jgi:hypothetical protein
MLWSATMKIGLRWPSIKPVVSMKGELVVYIYCRYCGILTTGTLIKIRVS